jgi:hypothetical protein
MIDKRRLEEIRERWRDFAAHMPTASEMARGSITPGIWGSFAITDIPYLLSALTEALEALEETADCLEDVATGKGGWAWEEVLDRARAVEGEKETTP